MGSGKTFAFQIDALDRITEAGRNGSSSPRKRCPGLVAENVVGKPVLDFIGDRETRHLYRILFDRIPLPGFSHGVCPDCEVIVRRETDALSCNGPDEEAN